VGGGGLVILLHDRERKIPGERCLKKTKGGWVTHIAKTPVTKTDCRKAGTKDQDPKGEEGRKDLTGKGADGRREVEKMIQRFDQKIVLG